jgi:serine phosphatase RsbU (regulator of sigma subunit)
MADAVFVVDVFGRVADVNPAAAHLFETSRGELIGQSVTDVLVRPPLTADRQRRIFDVQREPLRDRRRRPVGELVIVRDITARARAEQELERLLAERSRVAEALAQSLAPGRLPSIPGCEVASRYQPAGDGSEIGGDFYDIFTLGEDTWGVVLGDVSGKGAEAAAVTALARFTLRTLADHRVEPSSTLRELNTRLLAATDTERHCTLVYAQVRPTGFGLEMTLSLAGHHPPLVVRSTGVVEPVGELGTVLGLVEEADLYDVHLQLEPGDLICMFTDGLVEASNGTDLFSSERVAEILYRSHERPPEDLLTELVDAARLFHGRQLADDLALLLLRVCPGDA